MANLYREIRKEIQFEKRTRPLDYVVHIHEEIELVYIKKGTGIAYCDGKKYTLSENTFFCVFPNQIHHYAEFTEGEYLLLIVKPSRLLAYNDVFTKNTPISAVWQFEGNIDNNLVYLFETAFDEFERDGYSSVIEAYFTALFGKLLRMYDIQKSQTAQDTVLSILQYCADHYKESITEDDIAKHVQVSRSCVSHIFSSRLCINFCDYINSLRLVDAWNMLHGNNYTITEISNAAGFPTIRTFNRAFLKRYGVSPSEYRKSLKK